MFQQSMRRGAHSCLSCSRPTITPIDSRLEYLSPVTPSSARFLPEKPLGGGASKNRRVKEPGISEQLGSVWVGGDVIVRITWMIELNEKRALGPQATDIVDHSSHIEAALAAWVIGEGPAFGDAENLAKGKDRRVFVR